MQSGMFVSTAVERIVFGKPAAQALAAEVDRLKAQRVFLIVSGTMNRTTDEVAKVRAALGTRFAGLYDRMPSHTPRDAVIEASSAARAAGTDLIVTFGGGSVTDAGKIMQICLRHNVTDVAGLDAFHAVVNADGKQTIPTFEGPVVRQIAIPTTLSGGEFQPGGGCTDTRTKVKESFRHPLIIPRVSILDPAPTVHTPLWVWLSTGLRAVDHATEAICSPVSNVASDANFLQALRLLSRGLPRVKQDPSDLEARLDCQLAVWQAMTGRQGGAQAGPLHRHRRLGQRRVKRHHRARRHRAGRARYPSAPGGSGLCMLGSGSSRSLVLGSMNQGSNNWDTHWQCSSDVRNSLTLAGSLASRSLPHALLERFFVRFA